LSDENFGSEEKL